MRCAWVREHVILWVCACRCKHVHVACHVYDIHAHIIHAHIICNRPHGTYHTHMQISYTIHVILYVRCGRLQRVGLRVARSRHCEPLAELLLVPSAHADSRLRGVKHTPAIPGRQPSYWTPRLTLLDCRFLGLGPSLKASSLPRYS